MWDKSLDMFSRQWALTQDTTVTNSVLYMTLHLFGIFLSNRAVPTLCAGDQADGLIHHLAPERRVPCTNEVTLHLFQKLVEHLRLGMLQPKKYTLLTT